MAITKGGKLAKLAKEAEKRGDRRGAAQLYLEASDAHMVVAMRWLCVAAVFWTISLVASILAVVL